MLQSFVFKNIFSSRWNFLKAHLYCINIYPVSAFSHHMDSIISFSFVYIVYISYHKIKTSNVMVTPGLVFVDCLVLCCNLFTSEKCYRVLYCRPPSGLLVKLFGNNMSLNGFTRIQFVLLHGATRDLQLHGRRY